MQCFVSEIKVGLLVGCRRFGVGDVFLVVFNFCQIHFLE